MAVEREHIRSRLDHFVVVVYHCSSGRHYRKLITDPIRRPILSIYPIIVIKIKWKLRSEKQNLKKKKTSYLATQTVTLQLHTLRSTHKHTHAYTNRCLLRWIDGYMMELLQNVRCRLFIRRSSKNTQHTQWLTRKIVDQNIFFFFHFVSFRIVSCFLLMFNMHPSSLLLLYFFVLVAYLRSSSLSPVWR